MYPPRFGQLDRVLRGVETGLPGDSFISVLSSSARLVRGEESPGSRADIPYLHRNHIPTWHLTWRGCPAHTPLASSLPTHPPR